MSTGNLFGWVCRHPEFTLLFSLSLTVLVHWLCKIFILQLRVENVLEI